MIQDGQHMTSAVAASATATDDRGNPALPGGYVVTVRRTFLGRPDQIARVREFVRLALGPVPVLDEAVLLVSELTTNAVIHTASGDGGAFDVAVRRYPSAVRIEVHDAGSRRVPVPRPEDFMAEEGRGLDLVNLVADRWGHNGDQGSRSVFFELCW